MTQWSDYVKKYASEHGLTFSVAMKMTEVKMAYKEQKQAQIDIEILEEEPDPIVEIIEPILEQVLVQLVEIVEPIVEPVLVQLVEIVEPAEAPVVAPIEALVVKPSTVFISKKKRVRKIKA